MQSQNSGANGQVYYDPNNGQYYTMKNPRAENQSNNPAVQKLFGPDSPFYQAAVAKRNYLGMPNGSMNDMNQFMTNAQATPYAELTNLFPTLNAGLLQGIMSPTQTDGAMYGANRFIAPQTTNTQGK